MRVNRFQEAYELCKTALALDPQNEKAKELLSALERIRNRPAQDRWFHSEDEDAKFSRAMSSLMRENVTLERQ
jgi:hypothetical protein